tara:strand:- start:4 stop:381 length:378 start_codon:yes stop_codon:yes gene_type:complete
MVKPTIADGTLNTLPENWLTCMKDSRKNGHNAKEATRIYWMTMNPNSTQEEFESMYNAELKPMLDQAHTDQGTIAAMTESERSLYLRNKLSQFPAGHAMHDPETMRILFDIISTPPDDEFFNKNS